MVTEYTSNTTDVRELTSNVLAPDFPDNEIIKEQKMAYNHIAVLTHKFDWTVDDVEFPSVVKIEEQLTKCYIFEHYGGQKYREQVQYEKLQLDKDILAIKDNMTTIPTDEEEVITRTDSKSWNLNPDEPFTSKLSGALRADTMGVTD